MSSTYGFYGMLAKISRCADDPEREAKWLLYVDPDGDGTCLGQQVATALAKRTEELAQSKTAKGEHAGEPEGGQPEEASEDSFGGWEGRCWPCGSNVTCADLSKISACPKCTKPYDVWRRGEPQNGRQRAAEELPAIMERKPFRARSSSNGCEFCGMQIVKGTEARRCGKESSKGSSRRVCEDCVQKQGADKVDAAMALLGDDSTDEDWGT